MLLQPENRDTAAGIFLPLTYIKARDPRATVVILPSDHFVHPEDRFLDIMSRMVTAAQRLTDRVTLLAVTADRPGVEYGWIEPGGPLLSPPGGQVRAVRQFLEKPAEARAADALAAGALWNTLVMAAKIETLWTLGWRCFPEMMPLFEHVERTVHVAGDMPTLDPVYARMPIRNFSSGLLARAPEQVAVIEADGILWSDWGKPERIVDTLSRVGKQPAFPLELIAETPAIEICAKTFVGTSANALHIQIWTALIALLLLKYLQLKARFGWSLSNLVALLRMNLLVYRDLWAWLDDPFTSPPAPAEPVQGALVFG